MEAGAAEAGPPPVPSATPNGAREKAEGPKVAGGRASGNRIVRIAPDEAGAGTNALYVRPPGLLAFAYGDASCARHVEQARNLGARIERVERPGLRFDLDTPNDLERHERRRGRPHGERET